MNYEKKYKEALEKARQFSEHPLQEDSSSIVEYIFPELKESEDERIRKTLIEYFNAYPKDYYGELKKSHILAWLEKQGKQNIADKVEPKFNVGDWVVDNHGKVNQVTSVTDDSYAFTLYDGTYVSGCWKDYYHLWTIQDAKDGDVLVNGSNIFIFHFTKATRLMGYCHVNTDDGRFYDDIGKNECFCLIDAVVTPATNAQRDILFQKMKEAGYEWDAEKKELKPIDNRFDYEHANIQQKDFAPKAVTAHRQVYNRAILKILSNYVEKYPDIRFGQMLFNLDIKPYFDEESKETYCNLNETINKQK